MSLWGFSTRRKKPAARTGAKRTRRGRNRLGAIVEEHLEYEVPAELERYFFVGRTARFGAYCGPSPRHIMADAAKRVPQKLKDDHSSVWNVFYDTVRQELLDTEATLGRTPSMCVLPPKTSKRITEWWGTGQEKEAFSRIVKHERFHARAGSIRESFGVQNWPERKMTIVRNADRQLIKDFGEPARQAIQLAKKRKWTTKGLDNAEEVLARVEEIIEDCSYEGDAQTCGFARRDIDRQIKYENQRADIYDPIRESIWDKKRYETIDPDAFNKLVDMIESRYGSASDYYVNMVARITGRAQTRIPKRQPRLKPSERRAEEPAVVRPAEPKKPAVPRAPKPKPQPQPRWEEPIDDEFDEIEEAPAEPKKKKPVETQKWIDDDGQEWEVIVKPKRGKKKLAGASWWRKGLRS